MSMSTKRRPAGTQWWRADAGTRRFPIVVMIVTRDCTLHLVVSASRRWQSQLLQLKRS